MLLLGETCFSIIICMLEAVYFLCSVYYYFWKILQYDTKDRQMASELDITKDWLLQEDKKKEKENA